MNDLLKLNVSQTFELKDNNEQDINITLNDNILQTLGSVKGTVYDTTLLVGNVVEGATVKIFKEDGTPYMHTLTGADGSFTINDIELGVYNISAVKDGYLLSAGVPLIITGVLPITQNLVITPNLLNNQNIIYGIVKDSVTSLPIDGANVILYKNVLEEKVLVSRTTSILDGEYILENLEDGTYELIVEKNGYKIVDINDINLTGNVKIKADVSLENIAGNINSTISGFIKNSLGNIVPNAFVALYKVVDNVETLIATTYTNIEGKYMFGNVEAGSYLVKSKLTTEI